MGPLPAKTGKHSRDAEEEEIPSNNLWIGNLTHEIKDSDLMDLFAKYGALHSVTTYSSRSYAFVYFKRVEDAGAAKDALQGAQVRGNAIKIEFARPAKPCKNLWVGGIGSTVSKEQLEEEFHKFGNVEEFKFMRDRNTAFVAYSKLEDATEAMRSMNGKLIGGEQIRVDFLRSSRKERLTESRDSRDIQLSFLHAGARRPQHSQSSGGRKEGQPSNILWIGYPPAVQIDKDMLHNAMILFGEIERIKSFPDRHYSFVEFRSVDEARRAKEGLQGRLFNDPRITIMYSCSDLAPGKDYPSTYPGVRETRREMINEDLFGSDQAEIFDHPRTVGPGKYPGLLLQSSSVNRSILSRHPVTEYNDLPTVHGLRDGSSSWRRRSPSAAGILPSPTLGMRSLVRPAPGGWDVESNQFEREAKRSRIDVPSSVDDDSFPSRRNNDYGLGMEKAYVPRGRGVLDSYSDIEGSNGLSPAASRAPIGGPSKHHLDNDYIWRGTIAKGGTPVCHARCVPVTNGIDFELPEVVNCSARTGLDMLAKHYSEAIGFDVVIFLPDSEEDFASYTEFLRYLGSKDRAGVAKFDDGTTLFLVPPSDFLRKVLKLTVLERLYGVVLKLPQQVPSDPPMQPRQVLPADADYNVVRQDGHAIPMQSKLLGKSFYPLPTDSSAGPAVPQDNVPNSSSALSQSGVALTPELIATLASFLPANAQSSASESTQAASMRPSLPSVAPDKGTSVQGWRHDTQISGNTSHLQLGSQFSSQSQVQSHFQHYPSVSNAPSHSTNMVHGSFQVPESTVNLQSQGAMASRPLTSLAMPSPVGQYANPTIDSRQYQGSYVPPPVILQQQQHDTVALGANYSQAQSGVQQQQTTPQTQSGMQLAGNRVNWEHPNQVQQFPSALPGAGQGSDPEVDKNQRYQSTLQFAANLLMRIQQQQTSSSAAPGSGGQQ